MLTIAAAHVALLKIVVTMVQFYIKMNCRKYLQLHNNGEDRV